MESTCETECKTLLGTCNDYLLELFLEGKKLRTNLEKLVSGTKNLIHLKGTGGIVKRMDVRRNWK